MYGFADFQAGRAIADPRSDFQLAKRSKYGSSLYPVCSVDQNGQLEVSGPRKYPVRVPLTNVLSFSAAIEKIYLSIWRKNFVSSELEVADAIFSNMSKEAKDKNSELLVLLMSFYDSEGKKRYHQILEKLDIKFLDQSMHIDQTQYRLADGHPNFALHSLWANSLVQYLTKQGFAISQS